MTDLLFWWCLLATLMSVGVVGGFCFAHWLNAHRSQALDVQEARVQAGWNALHTAQRLHAGFWEARKLMRDEAIRRGCGRMDER